MRTKIVSAMFLALLVSVSTQAVSVPRLPWRPKPPYNFTFSNFHNRRIKLIIRRFGDLVDDLGVGDGEAMGPYDQRTRMDLNPGESKFLRCYSHPIMQIFLYERNRSYNRKVAEKKTKPVKYKEWGMRTVLFDGGGGVDLNDEKRRKGLFGGNASIVRVKGNWPRTEFELQWKRSVK